MEIRESPGSAKLSPVSKSRAGRSLALGQKSTHTESANTGGLDGPVTIAGDLKDSLPEPNGRRQKHSGKDAESVTVARRSERENPDLRRTDRAFRRVFMPFEQED